MSTWIDELAAWLLDYWLLATILLATAVLTGLAVRQPVQRILLSWTTLVGLFILTILCAAPFWPRLALFSPPSAPRVASERSDPKFTSKGRSEPSPAPAAVPPIAFANGITQGTRSSSPEPIGSGVVEAPAVVVTGFAFGVAIVSIWLLFGAIHSRRLCRAAFAAPVFAQQQLQGIVGSLAGMPRLLVSPRITIAAAWGVLQPTILLPSQAVDPNNPSALQMLLAHEWAHIRRRDLWLLALGRLLLVLLFAHPLYWLIRRRIRADQELIADAMAADSFGRHQYAENLVAWARHQPPARLGVTGALGIWERPGQLTRRITMLVDERICVQTQCSRGSRWTTVLASAALLSALSLVTLRPPPAAMAASTSGDSTKENAADAPGGTATAVTTTTRSGQITVGGKLVDTYGKPIARADVYLREQPTGWTSRDWQPIRSVNLAKITTDQQGEYRFENVPIPLDQSGQPRVFPLDVIAVADGYAVAWRHIPVQNPREPIQLTLQPESVLHGQLLADSRPIAGANIRAYQFTQLDQPARPPENGPRADHDEPNLKSPGYLDLRWSEIPLTAQTDREGRFALGRLPKGIRVALAIDDERFVRREAYAATTDQPQPNLAYFHNEPVRTGNFSIDLEPAHQLLVRVVFDDTEAPVPHSGVAYGGIVFPPQYSTDDKGRFTVRQLPTGDFRMWIYAPDKSDYLGVVQQVSVPRENPQADYVVRLPRGAIVAGKVLDEKTSGGVGGVEVAYLDQAKDHPPGLLLSNRVKTDATGAFRLAVAPGKGEVAVYGPVPGYVTWRSSGSISDNVPAKHRRAVSPSLAATVAGVEIRLAPVATYTGRTVDSQGKPVAAQIRSELVVSRSGGYFPLNWSTDAQHNFKLDGLFTASEVNADKRCHVIFTNQERKLAAMITLSHPDPDKALAPLEVSLPPMGGVESTVLGVDDKPLVGATVYLLEWSSLDGHAEPRGAPAATDSGGHFKFDTLISGVIYSIEISADGYKMPLSSLIPAANFQTNGSELKKLDDVHMLPVAQPLQAAKQESSLLPRAQSATPAAEPSSSRRGEAVEAAAPNNAQITATEPAPAQASDQPAADSSAPPVTKVCQITVVGKALDRDGKPIQGASIFLAAVGDSGQKALGQTTTDREGRYEFRNASLPLQPYREISKTAAGFFQIFGKAPGFAFTWQGMKELYIGPRFVGPDGKLKPELRDTGVLSGEKIEVDLTFESPKEISGHFADEKGRPIRGVKVAMTYCGRLDTGKYESRGYGWFDYFFGFRALDNRLAADLMPEQFLATSGPDGRFEFGTVPPGMICMLSVEHPDHAHVGIVTSTSDNPPPKWIHASGSPPVVKPPIEMTLPATKMFSLLVTLSDTQEPVAGVNVSAYDNENTSDGGTSDNDGKLSFKLPPGKFKLLGDPPTGVNGIRTHQEFVVRDAPAEQFATLRIKSGCVLILKAVDADNGAGIRGVSFWTDADQGWGGNNTRTGVQSRTSTKDDPQTNDKGELRAVVIPGKHHFGLGVNSLTNTNLGIYPLPAGYEAVDRDAESGRELDLPAGKTVAVEFKLRKT